MMPPHIVKAANPSLGFLIPFTHPPSRPDLLLELLQLLKLRLGGVILVQRIAAADHSVARRGRAIAERAANEFRRQRAFLHRIGQNRRVRQDHPAKANDVHPAIAHDVLRDVRQVFLQITVGGADNNR